MPRTEYYLKNVLAARVKYEEEVNLEHIASLQLTLNFLSVFALRPSISHFCPLLCHNTTLSELICEGLNLHFSNRHPNIAT